MLSQFREDDEIYIDCQDFEKGMIYRNPDEATKTKLNDQIGILETYTSASRPEKIGNQSRQMGKRFWCLQISALVRIFARHKSMA